MTDLSLDHLRRPRLALEARHDQSKRLYRDLHAQVLAHQARLSWQPEVKQVLETLQSREHERAVGAYEQMLTALLQDVLPGPQEVVMDLHAHGGLPALDIFRRKGLGQPLEDVLNGAGGSVANVLSTGLRAIALIRSGKRRFLVLDEADCWIKPAWAPRFASVIQQLAEQMNVQVLMISHHDESLFPMIPHRLRLERHAQGLAAQWSPSAEQPMWDPTQIGLRSILLEDVQSHVATHLPLAAGVTLLCGDNDIGKSTVVTALRAVFLGEANDTVIRHHCKSARVTLDFGPDHVLRWERHAKGKVREGYRLYRPEDGADRPLHATNGAKAVPDWLEPALGIGPIEGMDVQIGLQKEPIFLLNKPSTLRARALAIGQDAGHVQAMMAIDKRENADAKNAIKQGEQQLEQLQRAMGATQPLVDRRAGWEELERQSVSLDASRQEMEVYQDLARRWRTAVDRASALDALTHGASPTVPTLNADPRHHQLKNRWSRAAQLTSALRGLGERTTRTAPLPPQAPRLVALAERWRQVQRRRDALAHMGQRPELGLPADLSPIGQWRALAQRWRSADRRQLAFVRLTQNTAPAPIATRAGAAVAQALLLRWRTALSDRSLAHQGLAGLTEQEQQLALSSATCPQCGQTWSPNGP